MDFRDLITQYTQETESTPYTHTEVQQESISVAYVKCGDDGSLKILKVTKTTLTAAWASIVAETRRDTNRINAVKLVPFAEWENRRTPRRTLFAEGVPVEPNECLRKCLLRKAIDNPLLVVRWETPNGAVKRSSQSKLHAEDLTIAYVVHNSDGSFTEVKMRRSSMEAAWTNIVEETQSSNNAVAEMRMAPLEQWKRQDMRKRNVYSTAFPVQQNQCLLKFLQQTPIEDPVLLVCWEAAPGCRVCGKGTKWQYVLFTDTECEDGPMVLVHTDTGTRHLEEEGIQTIASSKFIGWITKKGWDVISLTGNSASVRLKI